MESIKRFETEYLEFLESKFPDILKEIDAKKALSDPLQERMRKSVEDFLKIFKIEA